MTNGPGSGTGSKSGELLLELRKIQKSYENGRIEALRGVDLSITAGEFLAITGASGSGKSTLLQLMGGLDSPTTGEVLFRGKPVGHASGRGKPLAGVSIDLDVYRAHSVGFIFQAFHLLPSLNALENVQVPMLDGKVSRRIREEKARALLVELGLEARIRQYPGQLSAGERQRVAIARSLANDPELLLADEPTGNLDSTNSAKVVEILAELQAKRAMTLVIVTHDDTVARSAQRHISMRDGRLCQ